MQHYIAALKKYAVFHGTASRPEYWYFVLFSIIFSIVASILDTLLGFESGLLNPIYSIAIFLPSLAVAVRRMHDIGKSGWWVLINIIPIIGWIWFFVLTVLPSKQSMNTSAAPMNGSM